MDKKKSMFDLDDELEEQVIQPMRKEINPEYAYEFDDDTLEGLKGDIEERLPDGRVRVGDKIYKAHQFRPNNAMAQEAVKARQAIARIEPAEREDYLTGITTIRKPKDIKEIRRWAKTYGMSRIMRIMENMNDADFYKAFAIFAPYLLPKLNAIDVKQSDDAPKSKNAEDDLHTIVVKDMTGGKVKKTTIEDE